MKYIDIKQEDGIALIVAMLALVVVSVLGITAIDTSTLQTKISGSDTLDKRALYIAETEANRLIKSFKQGLFDITQVGMANVQPTIFNDLDGDNNVDYVQMFTASGTSVGSYHVFFQDANFVNTGHLLRTDSDASDYKQSENARVTLYAVRKDSNTVLVRSIAQIGKVVKAVEVQVSSANPFRGAIYNCAVPSTYDTGSSPKDNALLNGFLVFEGDDVSGSQYIIDGEIFSNSMAVYYDKDNANNPVFVDETMNRFPTPDVPADQFAYYEYGKPNTGAAVYANQYVNEETRLRDLTGSEALFDTSKFIALAKAMDANPSKTNQHYFPSLADFINYIKTNGIDRNNPLKGVIVVDVDAASSGSCSDKKIRTTDISELAVLGTLYFNVKNYSSCTGKGFKLVLDVPVFINPARNALGNIMDSPDPTASTGFDPSRDYYKPGDGYFEQGRRGFYSGYPPSFYDPTSTDPNNPYAYTDASGNPYFPPGADLPALAYTNGFLDPHHTTNISGTIYTPNQMEIEHHNGDGKLIYLKGTLIGGGGMFFDLKDAAGVSGSKARTVISYDPQAVDSLAIAAEYQEIVIDSWREVF